MAATKNPQELLAAFEAGFNGLTPADERLVPIAQRLEPFREAIVARRKQGFSWKQIVEVLKQPAVGVETSHVTLRRLFADKSKQRRKKRSAVKLTLKPAAAGG